MNNDSDRKNKIHSVNAFARALEEVLREGARKLLQQAIEQEVEEYINKNLSAREPDNKRSVVRNGTLPARSILTGIGPVIVQQPRIRDKKKGCHFNSTLLPKYARKAPSLESVIPTLYLKGTLAEALDKVILSM